MGVTISLLLLVTFIALLHCTGRGRSEGAWWARGRGRAARRGAARGGEHEHRPYLITAGRTKSNIILYTLDNIISSKACNLTSQNHNLETEK